jgi:predicted transcriptional regulator
MAKTEKKIPKNIYLSQQLADEVREIAQSKGRSDSWVYSQAIEAGLKVLKEKSANG